MTSTSESTFHLLSATYLSPANAPFTHNQKIVAPSTTSTKDKTAYLAELRKAREVLQEKINQDLTSRMEEDNVRAKGNLKKGVDEGKEEENYGEEVVEEDWILGTNHSHLTDGRI